MAEIIGRSGDGFSGTAFFTKTYDEAVGLVVEARNYFAAAAAAEASGLTVAQQLGYCRESLRLTSRLMQIIGWLLVQRAVENRELTAEDARSDEIRISRARVYLDNEVVATGGLPPAIADLTARSRRLFVALSGWAICWCARPCGRRIRHRWRPLLQAKFLEALVELGHLASGIHESVPAAGPCRVGFGIDVERQGVALAAPGRTGLEGRAIGHDDVDLVVVGVGLSFHGASRDRERQCEEGPV